MIPSENCKMNNTSPALLYKYLDLLIKTLNKMLYYCVTNNDKYLENNKQSRVQL